MQLTPAISSLLTLLSMPRRRSRSRSNRPTLPRFAKSCYARRLRAELLEDRRMLATLVVQNNLDGDLATLAGDGELSLREAIAIANTGATIDGFTSPDAADTIEFDPAVFTGGAASLVRLTAGELEVTNTLVINGSTGVDVTITGDAAGDDIVDIDFITDVEASFGGTAGAPDDLLDDNSRVLDFAARSGDLSLHDLVISGGRTTGPGEAGGGIRFASRDSLNVTNSEISGNSTVGQFSVGGGIATLAGALTISNSTVSGNRTTGDFASGGGVSGRGELTLNGSVVSGNSTSGERSPGGGVYTPSTEVTLTNTNVSSNSTSGSYSEGGGIRTVTENVTLTESTVDGNSTAGDQSGGGGISTDYGDVTLTRSTVSSNSTSGISSGGGGIWTYRGSTTLTSSTISGNSTSGNDSHGGGVHSRVGGVFFTDSTITANASKSVGGVFVSDDSFFPPLLSLRNTILAGNTGDTAPDLRPASNSFPDVEFSLIGDATNLGISDSPDAGNLLDVDPFLGPLADNGGPTLTHAPLLGSPAIDAANSPQTADQRGLIRSVDLSSLPNGLGNASDIGAFEVQIPSGRVLDFPSNVTVAAEVLSAIDLSAAGILEESGVPLTITFSASDGVFSSPADGSGIGAGVSATLTSPIVVTLQGTAADLNAYFAGRTNLPYTAAPNAIGDNAAVVTVTVDSEVAQVIQVDVAEAPVVTTASDIVDPLDGLTSLREAIALTNTTLGAETIRFDPSVFTGGAASLIRLTDGELEITDALTIDGSTAVGVTVSGDANGDDITNAAFVTNVDASFIGGVFGPSLDLLDDNSRVVNFSAESGDLTLDSLTITGGRTVGGSQPFPPDFIAPNSGGGIRFSSAGLLTIANSSISGNSLGPRNRFDPPGTRYEGGGVYANAGDVAITGSTISGNSIETGSFVSGSARGGGVSTLSGSVTLTDSIVNENTVRQRAFSNVHSGGGIATSTGAITLQRSVVSGNSAASQGGALFSFSGPVVIDNSTLSTNSARRYGGGVYTAAATVAINNSTIVNNTGEAVHTRDRIADGASLSLRNSILAGSATSAGNSIADLFVDPAVVIAIDYSLIGDTAGSGIDATTGVGNILNADPLLGPLADNGGPTHTHALLPGSPAIDAGNSASATDQRGLPRQTDLLSTPNGDGDLSDIGAVEMQIAADTPSLVVTTISDAVSSIDGVTSLREAIQYVELGLVDENTISFDPNTFIGGVESLIRLTSGALDIEQTLTIDGRSASEVTITADAIGDDVTDSRFVTDVAASYGGTDGAADDLLKDNTRVIVFSNLTGDLTLAGVTLTGGNSRTITEPGVISGDPGGGGGVFFRSEGALTLIESTVSGNNAAGFFSRGGAVYSRDGAVVVSRSTFVGNVIRANNGGGGAIGTIASNVTIKESTFSDNYSESRGGGINSTIGRLTITNSTFSGNGAGFVGGGVSTGGAELRLISSTIVDNEGARGGGVNFFDRYGENSLAIQNTIIAGNTVSGDDAQADLSFIEPDSTFEISYSLIGDTTGSGVDATTGVGNLLNADPLLGSLADNGGPTLTHAPLLGSPVINRGDPDFVTTTGVDQRGNPFVRVAGGVVDIGAVEAQQTPTFAVGDYNRDGVVNSADYAVWRDAFDPTTPVPPLSGADGDGDGFVTRNDRDVWLSHVGFAFTPPAPSPIVAELAAEAPPLQQPAFLEPEPVATPAEPAPLATIDSAFALLTPSVAPQASPDPVIAQARVAAPIRDDSLLLLEFGVPGGLADEADNAFADDTPEEEPADDEALAVALGAFE